MKRTALILLALWVGAGCVHLPWQKDEALPPSEATPPVKKPQRRSAPHVTAEQITEHNAHEKVKALEEEIRSDDKGDEKPRASQGVRE